MARLLTVLMVLAATATSAPTAGPVTCHYTVSTWPTGFSADVRMVNHGPAIDGWTVELTFQAPTTLGAAWLARMSQPGAKTMTAENLTFNAGIPAGGAVTFGWTATAAVHEVPAMTVNGVPC
jgi:cellulase/cellobiase CelA1